MRLNKQPPEQLSLLRPATNSGGGTKVKNTKQPGYLSTQRSTESKNGCPNPDSTPIRTKETSSEILMRWAKSVMGYEQTYSALPTNNPVPKTDLNTISRSFGSLQLSRAEVLPFKRKRRRNRRRRHSPKYVQKEREGIVYSSI